jgi:hypothetical protein
VRKILVAAVSLTACLAGMDGFACGDKFLVIGRGPRSQRAKGAVQKAAILMYMDSRSGLPAAIKEEGLESDLKLAGHKVRVLEDRREFGETLRAQRYDIVLAGISDMESLERELGSTPSRPILLPIVYDPTSEELAAARRRFECVMRSPSKKQHYLAVIDDAMVLRQKRAHAAPAPKEER